MSVHKRVVEKYMEGWRRGDHAQILTCLADDVVWVLHGYKTLRGKDAFDAEIKNAGFEGDLVITVDRLIEEGDTVVAAGSSVAETAGERRELAFCELFRFSGETVSRLDTYHVWLS
jgi:ketosteroid isomerase-like protein